MDIYRSKYFLKFKSEIKKIITSNYSTSNHPIGAAKDEVIKYLLIYNIPEVFSSFKGKTSFTELYYVFWWGTCIADIVLPHYTHTNESMLLESGHFNLAVALFDTLIDEHENIDKNPLKILNSKNLLLSVEKGLLNPLIVKNEPMYVWFKLSYDFLLKLNLKFSSNPNKLFELNNLLHSMYSSEIRACKNLLLSKELPIYFIGAMNSDFNQNAPTNYLFKMLSQIISYWDDWIDLREDAINSKPNHFLSPNKLVLFIQRRLSNNHLFHYNIYNKHRKVLRKITDLCNNIGEPIKSKTFTLLYYLFCERPNVF